MANYMGLESANFHWQTGIRIGMPVVGMLWFAGMALAAPTLPVINTNNIIVITNAACTTANAATAPVWNRA